MGQYEKCCYGSVNGGVVLFSLRKTEGSLFVSLRSRRAHWSHRKAFLFTICFLFSCYIINPIYPAIVMLVFFLVKALSVVKEERLLIIKGLGYQISKKLLVQTTSSFIPQEQVQKVFINEVILRYKVVYILTLLVQEGKSDEKLVPLFVDTLPRLDCLELMYRNIKHFVDR